VAQKGTQKGTQVPDESERHDESIPQAARRGQWWATPVVILGSVATVVWVVAGLITGALLLIWWLL
jgi:hypothetical protein